jgi:polyhydroxybutyrate depolymerase
MIALPTLGCHSDTKPSEYPSDAGHHMDGQEPTTGSGDGGHAAHDGGQHDGGASLRDASTNDAAAQDAQVASDASGPARLVPGCSKDHATGRETLKFDVDGAEREVLIYVPQGYTGRTPLPLTFNLHGSGGDPAGHQDYTGIEPLADQKGFIVAAIAGYNHVWNVARSPDRPDDVKFAEVILDWAEQNLCMDPARVYSTGFSGGARTSSRFACALPERIRAIAPVAGVRNDPPCDASGIPLLTIHGTGDQTNFYNGCNANDTGCSRNGEWVESVDAAISDWRHANGCTDNVQLEQVSDKVERQTWSECSSGAPVVFYKVSDGAHVWQLLPNTTEVVLDFFLAH